MWWSLVLSEVMAKMQNPSVVDPRFDNFLIPSLQEFIGREPHELLLCPRCYLRRVKTL